MRHSAVMIAVVALAGFLAAPPRLLPATTPEPGGARIAVASRDAQSRALPNVTGRWSVRLITGTATVTGTVEIEQKDGAIEGTWTPDADPGAQPVPVTGETVGETITLVLRAAVPEDADVGRLELVGQIGNDENLLTGTFTKEEGARGEWTARRASAATAAATRG